MAVEGSSLIPILILVLVYFLWNGCIASQRNTVFNAEVGKGIGNLLKSQSFAYDPEKLDRVLDARNHLLLLHVKLTKSRVTWRRLCSRRATFVRYLRFVGHFLMWNCLGHQSCHKGKVNKNVRIYCDWWKNKDRDLSVFETSRSREWQFSTEVSGQNIGSILLLGSWTLALGDFINPKSNILSLQHNVKYLFHVWKKRSLICIGL